MGPEGSWVCDGCGRVWLSRNAICSPCWFLQPTRTGTITIASLEWWKQYDRAPEGRMEVM